MTKFLLEGEWAHHLGQKNGRINNETSNARNEKSPKTLQICLKTAFRSGRNEKFVNRRLHKKFD